MKTLGWRQIPRSRSFSKNVTQVAVFFLFDIQNAVGIQFPNSSTTRRVVR